MTKASMWPRPRGRGIANTYAATGGFTALQCGHGRAAVESLSLGMFSSVPSTGFQCSTAARPWNPDRLVRSFRVRQASMWPRPRGRGID